MLFEVENAAVVGHALEVAMKAGDTVEKGTMVVFDTEVPPLSSEVDPVRIFGMFATLCIDSCV